MILFIANYGLFPLCLILNIVMSKESFCNSPLVSSKMLFTMPQKINNAIKTVPLAQVSLLNSILCVYLCVRVCVCTSACICDTSLASSQNVHNEHNQRVPTYLSVSVRLPSYTLSQWRVPQTCGYQVVFLPSPFPFSSVLSHSCTLSSCYLSPAPAI